MDDRGTEDPDHYEELSPQARARVAKRMTETEGDNEKLSEAQHLASVLDTARRFDLKPVPDDVLAYLAVMKMLGQEPREADMQQQFCELEASIREDPQLKKRYENISTSIQKLDEQSNAYYQFESLVDRKLEPKAVAEPETPEYQLDNTASPAGQAGKRAGRDEYSSKAVSDPPESSHKSNSSGSRSVGKIFNRRSVRFGFGLAAVIVLLVASLLVISHLTTPEMQRIAYFDAEELRVEGFGDVTRSGGEQNQDVQQRVYLNGLEAFGSARITTLGLFPRYDMDQLQAAESYFIQVSEAADEGGFLHTEALFWKAQTQLLQEQIERAVEALQLVVMYNGRMAQEAERQLAQLH